MKQRLVTGLATTAALAASILISSGTAATAATTPSAPPAAESRGAGGVTPNSQLPPAIQVDETQFKIVATLRGIGKQVYDCDAAQSKFVFREPIAGLFTPRGIPAGIHGAGPFWANFDGSKFIGTGAGTAPAPNPTSDIAWLKVAKASTAGVNGAFSNVVFVQRTDTRGGVAPTSCAAPATASVDYTTNYVFWAPK